MSHFCPNAVQLLIYFAEKLWHSCVKYQTIGVCCKTHSVFTEIQTCMAQRRSDNVPTISDPMELGRYN